MNKLANEGQLCPHCGMYLLLSGSGWWRCAHCGGDFWCVAVEGDYEDYHCFTRWDRPDEQPPYPDVIPIAFLYEGK